jgi:GAF domain-containing protein
MSTVDTADDLTRKVQELERELAEARQQQAGTSDILRVISGSTTDISRVFDAMARSAARLCEAFDVIVLRVDGDVLRLVAHYGPMPARDVPLHRGTLGGRTVIERRLIHIEDLQIEIDEFPEGSAIARERGHRTTLSVPLLKDGAAIGNIQVRRNEVRLFSDQQISLLKTFADQAVIAIENTRLFEAEQASKRELQESLHQQTATADVLKAISRSTFDLQPVLEALIKDATKLCAAEQGFIFRSDGELYHLAADYNAPAGFREWTRRRGIRAGEGTVVGRVALEDRTIQILDAQADAAWRTTTTQAPGTSSVRTLLGVPMRREGVLIGVIAMWRTEIRPFTDKQVALVETFADQAVIAIENTRLLNELRESLQQQTATADVLKVISRSALDVQKVLDALVESAARLCNAYDATILQVVGDSMRRVAHYGQIPFSVPAGSQSLMRGLVAGRAILERRTIQIADILAEADEYPEGRTLALQTGFRTALAVPLVHAGEAIGVIFIRRTEVRPFTERQVELVNTFADQAVIAIENTRLFEEVQARNQELRTALEQQTATSELLKVIGRSTFELQPVFDTLAENAVRLCAAERAFVHRFDGQFLRVAATYNVSPELRAFVERNPMAPGRYGVAARAALERRTVHIRDVQAEPEITFAAREIEPVRTALSVPMLRSEELLGVIMIYRHEVSPFTDSQVALIETFADQAAIAVENSRLLEELQARNGDLTALGEVGRAVSSTLDLKVVLKTIVDRAVELSGTGGGSIFYFREDIGRFQLGETTGLDEEVVTRFRELDIAAGQTGLGEAIAKREPLQVPDILDRPSNPLRDAAIEAGLRAVLIVPLLGRDGPLGALVLQRRQPGEFRSSVVTLMQSFAVQSAIALENARTF